MSQPPLVARWRLAVEAARDPVRAAGTAACMRHQFAFAGVSLPRLTRREAERGVEMGRRRVPTG